MHRWAVWLDADAVLCFSTGGRSRKARNQAADPRCAVAPELAEESVVVNGVAERVTDAGRIDAIRDVYTGKYGSGFPDPGDNPVFAVHARVVIGIIEHDPDFSGRATRWRFPATGS